MYKPSFLLGALLFVLMTAGGLFGASDPAISGPDTIRSGYMGVFKVEHATAQTTFTFLPKGVEKYFHRCGDEIIFARRDDGYVKIILVEDRPGKEKAYIYQFVFFNATDGPLPPDPGPGPDPGPDPPDPLPPDPLPGLSQVCFVAESGTLPQLPRPQQTMLGSLSLQEEIKKAGHKFIGNLDPQTYGADCSTGVCGDASNAPADYKAWLDAAKGQKLPVLLTAPVGGGTIKAQPLPADDSALWTIIGGKP